MSVKNKNTAPSPSFGKGAVFSFVYNNLDEGLPTHGNTHSYILRKNPDLLFWKERFTMEDIKMIEEQHLQTADRFLLTELLVNTMEKDRSFFLEKTIKLGHYYQELFDVLILRIKQDLHDIKQAMQQHGIRLARADAVYPGFIVYDILRRPARASASVEAQHEKAHQ
ncbi:hypothetical protein [Sinobaca sp. H24]|uniref:hypothetical protein n=1 Tax=Sinobaca sp. H24 TaxID=2923376 RepID=UPI00207A79B2|nr:hypothetical protein [Sinobaca sp. H24]